jgi:hypothetical protein
MRRRGASGAGRTRPPELGDAQLHITGLVDNNRDRDPLRWAVRVSVRSYRPAPMCRVASASIRACSTRPALADDVQVTTSTQRIQQAGSTP